MFQPVLERAETATVAPKKGPSRPKRASLKIPEGGDEDSDDKNEGGLNDPEILMAGRKLVAAITEKRRSTANSGSWETSLRWAVSGIFDGVLNRRVFRKRRAEGYLGG